MSFAHTNELIHETSPYLLQHAHNPVNWLPWGEKAFALAQKEDKPILVSIGYAACHWCHVMERESFEDESTAELMNAYFVCVKIDREERPDVDHLYMDAVQAMTGAGGWPLNVFLTPDLKPFYGGTYFPPVRAYNRPSWKELLVSVHKGWGERRSEIVQQAEGLLEHLAKQSALEPAGSPAHIFNRDTPVSICENLLKQADNEQGGFGHAPKFPQFSAIAYLLEHDYYAKHPAARKHALLTLQKMIDGGIYDQLGHGLARYSTDDNWLVPHFEKMMYDNALLVPVLCDAYGITGDQKYRQTFEGTLAFMQRELMNEDHGFYTAIDADSEGLEGKFYTWSLAEVKTLLGPTAPFFCEFYGITEAGNFRDPHHPELPAVNILHRSAVSLAELARKYRMNPIEATALIRRGRERLFAARQERVRPLTDDKLLLALNAMANLAFTRAYAATGDEQYLAVARKNMQFILQTFPAGNGAAGGFRHQVKHDTPAFLDDYAWLIKALIELQEATGETQYLETAGELTKFVLANFSGENSPLFFFTADNQKDIIVRKKEIYDGSQPSSNAVMCENLLKMAIYFDRPEWENQALQMLETLAQAIVRYPASFAAWAGILQKRVRGYCELVLSGADAEKNLPEILRIYVPGKLVMTAGAGKHNWPLLQGKDADNEFNIHICANKTCLPPVKLPEQMALELANFIAG